MQPHYDLLLILACALRGQRLPRSVTALAKDAGLPLDYVCNALALLAERGHVEDKRETQEWTEVSCVRLTPAGKQWAVGHLSRLEPLCQTAT